MDVLILCILYILLTIGIILVVGRLCTVKTAELSHPVITFNLQEREDEAETILRHLIAQNPSAEIRICTENAGDEAKKIVQLLARDYPYLKITDR